MKLFGMNAGATVTSTLTMDELDDYLRESIDDRQSETPVENEVKIFRNAVDFKDTEIAECMIPRNEIVAVPIDGTEREELTKLFINSGLSKIVVYNGDIDDVVGYIHVSELFNTNANWRKKINPVLFTPETMLANKMMRRMMSEKRTLAIVVDEFGGTSGLVTLEDIVEEIFGEIEDEHDRKRIIARRIGKDAYIFSGRAEVASINEDFGLGLKESEEYHTIAGYILENLEALPKEGDSFDIGELKFTIKKMSTTKIELIKVEKN
jgi:CBS domain containing-hemolysin-like protein